MSNERCYYTRPRLIPPVIPISLLLASALYLAGQFVQLPWVSGGQSSPPVASAAGSAAGYPPGK